MGWIIAALIVVAYAAIGQKLARRGLPAAWERARDAWSMQDTQRESVQIWFILMSLSWPVMAAWRLVADRTRALVEANDPVELQRQNAELRTEIARLEREAGIK